MIQAQKDSFHAVGIATKTLRGLKPLSESLFWLGLAYSGPGALGSQVDSTDLPNA